MRSTTSFCSMKCWSTHALRRCRAGGTGSASRCCRAGCRRRAAARRRRRPARRNRPSARRPRSTSSCGAAAQPRGQVAVELDHREPAERARPAAASARRGRGRSRPSRSPGRGSIARTIASMIAVVGQEMLAEALARDWWASCGGRRGRRCVDAAGVQAAARATRRRRGRAPPAPSSRRPRRTSARAARCAPARAAASARASTRRRSTTWIRCTPKRETTGSAICPGRERVHRLLELGHEHARARPSRDRRPARRWRPANTRARAARSRPGAAGLDLRA